MPTPPHLLRLMAYSLSHQIIRALMRALGLNGIAAFATAEWILVDALVGSEQHADELHLIDVLAGFDDAMIRSLVPELEGMRSFALALAEYRERVRREAAQRSFLARMRIHR